MNKILLILSLVLLASCSPKEVASGQLVERQGIKYEVNSTTPFTGVVMDYHDNGQLKEQANYKDGVMDGLFQAYHENAQLRMIGQFKDGKEYGLWELYHENGQLRGKGNYKDGKFDGLLKGYHENGQVDYKECYNNGEEVDMSYCEQ